MGNMRAAFRYRIVGSGPVGLACALFMTRAGIDPRRLSLHLPPAGRAAPADSASGGPDGAVCEPTGDAADLAVTAADLGAALLGGTSLHARAGVGTVVEQRPGALVRAAAAFGPLGRAPHCPMVF